MTLLRDICGATSCWAARSHLTCPTRGDAWAPGSQTQHLISWCGSAHVHKWLCVHVLDFHCCVQVLTLHLLLRMLISEAVTAETLCFMRIVFSATLKLWQQLRNKKNANAIIFLLSHISFKHALIHFVGHLGEKKQAVNTMLTYLFCGVLDL